ncbi:MAG: hypothetical protein OEL54_03045 [Flavobacteriaceae bacterium]|nr:hypothetical protein [Flavobacteriaceae bacterium]
MLQFGLVDKLRTYCTANNIAFVYGNEDIQNAILGITGNVQKPNVDVLFCMFDNVIDLKNGRISSLKYRGFIALGRHCETNTSSSIDETPLMKFDRRFQYLNTKLLTIISTICCENELAIEGDLVLKEKLNMYDENIDTIGTDITFLH